MAIIVTAIWIRIFLILQKNVLNTNEIKNNNFFYLEIKGIIVTPECPPITGTLTSLGFNPLASAIKVLALTMSKLVTPNNLLGSNLPACKSQP